MFYRNESHECITNIQRFSLHDGGGIRTVAFLKGCPFHCPWCCNPETLSFKPEIAWHQRLCIYCSVREDGSRDSNGCPCDIEPKNCPTGAKELIGSIFSVDKLVKELIRDKIFFEESGGGVTLSGGECLAGRDRQTFCCNVLEQCKLQHIHTAVETTLAVKIKDIQKLIDVCDIFLVDFKISDVSNSLKVTGVDPNLRDYNLKRILSAGATVGATVIARMPIIPGFTDNTLNVKSNVKKICALGIHYVDVLPFHQLGEDKYTSLGFNYALKGKAQFDDKDVAEVVTICKDAGLDVTVHGR
jgi:pyruvate formate lyase activating enzyme